VSVLFVANDSHSCTALFGTAEFTVERNHTNVMTVAKQFLRMEVKILMRTHMGEKPYK